MSARHQETVQKQFTRTVEEFSAIAPRDTSADLEEKLQFARPQPGELALDVACGPGTLALGLAAKVGFARGVDITAAMLQKARQFQRERGAANVTFDQAEAERLPYPDGAFDLVCCQFALHHIAKPFAVLQEMKRVARPEGRLLVIDTLGPESEEKWDLHNRIEKMRDPSHVDSMRLTTFMAMFDDLGLRIARQRIRSRARSFNHWMLRAALKPSHKRFREVRQMILDAMPGDLAGFGAHAEGDDIVITHHEGMFLLHRNQA